MSRSVEVHPLAIALSVVTGTLLAGIVGALLAVPFVAFLNATVHALRKTPVPDDGPVTHRDQDSGDQVDPVAEERSKIDGADKPARGSS
jgi:predicted PurR-regulated permease PerM